MENAEALTGPSEVNGSSAVSSDALRYAPRVVKPRPAILVNGYRLKVYELYYEAPASGFRLGEEELRRVVGQCLPAAKDPLEHRAGFVIAHFARDGSYLLVSRWYGGNMLKHDLFEITESGGGWQIKSLSSTGIVACIWELQVIAFERQAWVNKAMTHGGREGSLRQYMDTLLEGSV